MNEKLEKPLMTIENPTPLQALAKIETRLHYNNWWKYSIDDLEVIKNALARLEEIDNGEFVPIAINRYNELCDKKEVLEIIKKKAGDFGKVYYYKTFEDYIDSYGKEWAEKHYDKIYTVIEFNLIKEWLEKWKD